jgi:DNA processing protein
MSISADKEELVAALILSRLAGVGASGFRELLTRHRLPSEALKAYSSTLPRKSRQKATLTALQLDSVASLPPSMHSVYFGGPGYPWLLAQLSEPPPLLFAKGPMFPIPPLAVAIVGARRCTAAGAAFARELAAGLATRGVVIVSGGARGIDAAAHRGALEAGGHTVLVTATGIDRFYPRENEPLYRQIEACGAIVTELLPGTPPRRDFFPTRNRIITGLSDATVIVEGTAQSGTASSARHAARAKRQLFTWRGSEDPELGALPEELLGRGAQELKSADAETLLRQIKAHGDPAGSAQKLGSRTMGQ